MVTKASTLQHHRPSKVGERVGEKAQSLDDLRDLSGDRLHSNHRNMITAFGVTFAQVSKIPFTFFS